MLEAIIGFLMIFIISCMSLIGIFMISVKDKVLDKILFILIAFATGTILASALFDLIPEAIHHYNELSEEGVVIAENTVFIFILLGFVVFFIMERFIYWFHGHAHEYTDELVCYANFSENEEIPEQKKGHLKNFVFLNLAGDGLHNFLDGIIIMVSFLNEISTGIIVTLAVFFHEFPQEIGDFGLLVYGGFSKKKALLFNFLSALVAMLGGLIAYLLTSIVEIFNLFFLAFSGGGFLFLACTELMPELLKEKNIKKSVIQTIIFLSGMILIISLILILPHK
ncbi:MAG: ZIP family metal transporter [Promethearchaeota archaeon]